MLEVGGLNVSYGDSHILRNVDLMIPQGQVVCLMGRNGVGKTTLLKSLIGLLVPRSGRVIFNGEDLTSRSPDERARLGIGYVPQGREIFPHLTVKENLLLGRVARGQKGDQVPKEVYELFPGLEGLLHRRGGDLSGGQQQQLAIARVWVTNPKLLLLDEPTEGIQPSIILEIESAIHRIRKSGVSILLVEQYLQFAWRLADIYYVMEKGMIVSKGSTKELSEEVVKRHLAV